MGLNIKNIEVERLAAEVAELAHESKTEAIRVALNERKSRLQMQGVQTRKERILAVLERIWRELPDGARRPITKKERERILGYGPDGV